MNIYIIILVRAILQLNAKCGQFDVISTDLFLKSDAAALVLSPSPYPTH